MSNKLESDTQEVMDFLTTQTETPEDALDEEVHDCFSAVAANINNEGFASQIATLLGHGYTPAQVIEKLKY